MNSGKTLPELCKNGHRLVEVGTFVNGKSGQVSCRGCSRRHSALSRKRRTASGVLWKHKLKKQYDMTPEQFNAMLERQDHRCLICEVAIRRPYKVAADGSRTLVTGDSIAIDHDHETKAVRGLLCSRCNSALGLFDDEPERLRRAADYIERNRT